MSDVRYVPRSEGVNAAFHSACIAAAAVCVQHCLTCGRYQHPPRLLCSACGGADHEYEPQGPDATCMTAVVTHRATSPGWTPPYTTVVAQLPSGPRVIAAWEAASRPTPGDALTVTVRVVEDRFAFLVATPSRTHRETA